MSTTDTLPCGVAVAAVVAHHDHRHEDGHDVVDPSHVAGCQFCGDVMASLSELDAATSSLASIPVPAPPSLVAGVMSRVSMNGPVVPARPPRPDRRTVGGPVHAVTTGPRGTVWIADQVFRKIIRRAASVALIDASVPRRERVDRVADVEIEVGTTEVVGTVSIETRFGVDVSGRTNEIRDAVAAEIASLTGLRLARLDVRVVGYR